MTDLHDALQISSSSEITIEGLLNFSVNLLRPTPFGKTLYFTGETQTLSKNKAEVEMNLYAGKLHCASGKGLFVGVKEGHPAFHRW